jgi:uncharacterized protein YegL
VSEAFTFPEQIAFGTDNFAENPEPRCPVVLLLDTSGSMSGRPIQELNDGLITFKDELMADSLASKRVEVSIITFGPVNVSNDFCTAEQFNPSRLHTTGDTPIGAAINLALDKLANRKQVYRDNGISFFRPWVFMITDGAPTDPWKRSAERIKEGEASKSFAFFAVGVEGANMETLAQISVRQPLLLKGLRFRDLFVWLSSSMKSVSRSVPGTDVPIQNPTGPEGWASV